LFQFGSDCLKDPRGVAVDESSGNICVSDPEHGLVLFDSQGGFLQKIECHYPYGITFNPTNSNIVACGYSCDTVFVFDSKGNMLFKFDSPDPSDVVVDAKGNIVVTSNWNPTQVFDSQGNFLHTLDFLGTQQWPDKVCVCQTTGSLLFCHSKVDLGGWVSLCSSGYELIKEYAYPTTLNNFVFVSDGTLIAMNTEYNAQMFVYRM